MGAHRNSPKGSPKVDTEGRRMGAHRNNPKESPKQKSTTLRFLLDLDSKYDSGRAPHSKSAYGGILFLISLCTYTYTFTDPSESPSQQNLKRDKLVELLSIIKSLKKPLPDEILSPLFAMISTNLFRPLPPPSTSVVSVLPDDDDLVATPAAAWPHLHIVYDILFRLVQDLEAKALSEYVDDHFILSLLTLFQSEDPRERDSLKNVYHKIYSKLHSSRSFMRKAMNDAFLHYIFETEQKHCGIGDLLEIWGTISMVLVFR